MQAARNPFTPTFGMVPPFMAGRDRLMREMERAFDDGLGNPNLATILIGARGTGKTTLLSRIAAAAQERSWVAVNVVAAPGMLEDIVQQTGKAAAHLIEPAPTRRLSAIGIGQMLNLEWVFEESGAGNWRTRMEALLNQLSDHNTGLLITVDEVRSNVEEVVLLVSTYQLLIREGYRVALVMAGLPTDVTDLISDERVTFLRRARQQHIGRISDGEVRVALRRTVESAGKRIDTDALDTAVKAAGGFAYMMQLVGYFIWEEAWNETCITSEAAHKGVAEAQEDFTRGVIEATCREMSDKDLEFALAMLPDSKGSRLGDIAQRMGVTNGYASTYKRRLLKQGVIGERPGGLLDFDIPLLRPYLANLQTA